MMIGRHFQAKTGRALLVTTLVLSLGFYIFMLSEMANVFRFGLLTATTIILALFGDFFLTPAILRLMFKDKSPEKGQAAEALSK